MKKKNAHLMEESQGANTARMPCERQRQIEDIIKYAEDKEEMVNRLFRFVEQIIAARHSP